MNPSAKQFWGKILMCSSLTLAPLSALALPDDRDQPIKGAADNLVIDQKNGLATYTGNVTIQQGSLLIHADKIVIHTTAEGAADKIIADGNPARFEQQPNRDQSIIKAQASKITYTPNDERLLLVENASVAQDGDTMSGPQIDYNLANEVMKAAGSNNGAGRVEFVITPKATKDNAKPAKDNAKPVKDSTKPAADTPPPAPDKKN